jgi:hypothetical protein
MIEEATAMFNAGWDVLEDGVAIQTKGSYVAVKSGNKVVTNEMDEKIGFSINSGKVNGNVTKVIQEKEVSDAQKESLLAQAIITKYYTIKRA